MKLFVWKTVLYDYGPGLAVVLAENVAAARMLAVAELFKQYDCYCYPDKNGRVDREYMCKPCRDAEEFDRLEPEEYPTDAGIAFLKMGSA